jgi:glycosyltransferase involved in cell wall biosynthesis
MPLPYKKICIVIPCYNESTRLPVNEFITFLKNNSDTFICFVNDGSKDATIKILEQIKESCKENTHIVSYLKNMGKAEAVRRGMQYCSANLAYNDIAYLDADLSTSLAECVDISKYLNDKIDFCFGSRIMKVGSVIERSFKRFLIGRVIATAISNTLDIKVYDTQCGCKVMKKELSENLFKEPFVSGWLFDVELFARMVKIYGRPNCLSKMIEVPLLKWIDKGESKVKLTYAFRLWFDLYTIKRKYKKALRVKQ